MNYYVFDKWIMLSENGKQIKIKEFASHMDAVWYLLKNKEELTV
jgi:hypothetical protein